MMNWAKATLCATSCFLFFLCATKETEASITGPTWTYMVYIAAANDLEIFAPRNIRQMQQIGSNERVNIIVQHNTYEKKTHHSKTFYIEKGSKKLLKETSTNVDSGDPQTLINFCCDAIATYTADHYALVLWNHGTGTLEPSMRSNICTSELFSLDDHNDYFEETKCFWPLSTPTSRQLKQHYKGMCFNHYAGTFFTEQKLCMALKTICATSLQGKKLDFLGFDACLMSMLEVGYAMAPYARIMVASQDVERGTGWDYYYALYPFLKVCPTPEQLGAHTVHAYAKAYKKTNDYTQTCLSLEVLPAVAQATSRIAFLLQKFLKNNDCPKARVLIALSKNKHMCTHFDEPEFIDAYHFYTNLLTNIEQIPYQPQSPLEDAIKELRSELTLAQELIKKAVIENKTGTAYPYAQGISIYFPEHALHSSYKKCLLAQTTHWFSFLKTYLSRSKK